MNPFIKTMVAGGVIANRRLVMFTANDGEASQATGPTVKLAGVLDCPGGAVLGQRIDVIMFGPADIEYGGTVAPGAAITSDANGKAVAAAPAGGTNNSVAGHPLVNAVAGDIAKSIVNIGSLQG